MPTIQQRRKLGKTLSLDIQSYGFEIQQEVPPSFDVKMWQ